MTMAAPAYPYVRSFFVAQKFIDGAKDGGRSGGPTVFGGTPSTARRAELPVSPHASEFPHGQTIACALHGVVCYISNVYTFRDSAMNKLDEYTVPQAAAILSVSEETVRRNIRSKRLVALRRGTQWFVQHEVLEGFAKNYDPKTGKIKEE